MSDGMSIWGLELDRPPLLIRFGGFGGLEGLSLLGFGALYDFELSAPKDSNLSSDPLLLFWERLGVGVR